MKKLENTIENIRIDTAITELSPEYDLNFTRSKIQKMIENGNRIYDNIKQAYSDI